MPQSPIRLVPVLLCLLAVWLSAAVAPVAATALPYVAISAAGDHLCALRSDGTALCWGDNQTGQSTPPAGETFTQISSARFYTCGLRPDQTAACWGHPQNPGPYGGTEDRGQATPPAEKFKEISSSRFNSCGIRLDDTVTCWGWASPTLPTGTFAHINLSDEHGCGLRLDQTISCWGYNTDGQTDAPAGRYQAVQAGSFYSCALGLDGAPTCWGNYATPLPDGQRFKALDLESGLTCGIDLQDAVQCFGYNGYPGNYYGATDPMAGPFTAVSAGSQYKCALRPDGTISCSGEPYFDDFLLPQLTIALVPAPGAPAPAAQAAEPAAFAFAATGGTGDVAFRLTAGALPDGLTLNTDGTVAGTTSDTAPHSVEVQAVDSQQISDVRRFIINPHRTFLPLILQQPEP